MEEASAADLGLDVPTRLLIYRATGWTVVPEPPKTSRGTEKIG